MNFSIDPTIATALADLTAVDHVPVDQRVDAILRHYLTDLHDRLAPAAASVAAVVTGEGLHRETLEGPVWPGPRNEELEAETVEFARLVAEHAVEHLDEDSNELETKPFEHQRDEAGNLIPPDVTPDPDRAAAEFITDAAGHACTHDGCTFVAKNDNGLAIHQARKHRTDEQPTETPWSCCGQSFRSPQALGSHRRHRHPKAAATPAASEPVAKPEDPAPEREPDPLLDAPRKPVSLFTCVVCRSRVATVRNVRGIGDCCRDCAKAAR